MHPNDTSVHQLHCFRELANSSPRWVKQCWGDNLAVGFRGSEAAITQAHNLFVNFDSRPKDYWGFFPKPPRLTYLDRVGDQSLAYIYISQQRLLDSLILYFEVMIGRETGSWHLDPITEEQEWQVDGPKCEALAKQAAQAFIDQHIVVESFMPDADTPIVSEYRVGAPGAVDYDGVDRLAERTLSQITS